MKDKPPGKVITFYSYKGGTGRSMALANLGWILADAGKRVLMVDWDLEAPGLHHYFRPFLADSELTSTEGVIDFVIECSRQTVVVGEADDEGAATPKNWHVPYANILRHAVSLDWDFPGDGTLDFIPAGRQGASYSTRVNSFNWEEFYEDRGGGAFIEEARRRMCADYEYVLVDSRTGVSDTSGICTVQLPDTLIVFFTPNNQSIHGAAAVANSVQKQKPEMRIFPVPSRIDQFEQGKLTVRLRLAKREFAPFLERLDPAVARRYWGDVEVPYIPYYSYEEILAAIGDDRGRRNTLLSSTERLADYVIEDTLEETSPIPSAIREEILKIYAGQESKGLSAVLEEQRQAKERQRELEKLAAVRGTRLRNLLIAAGVVTAVTAGLIYWQTARERNRELATRLATQSEQARASDPQLGLLLAVESMKRNPSPQGDAAIRAGLSRLPWPRAVLASEMAVGPSATDIELSPTGESLAVLSNPVAVVGIEEAGAIGSRRLVRFEPTGLSYSRDGRYLGIMSEERGVQTVERYPAIYLVDPVSGRTVVELSASDSPFVAFALGPSGSSVAAVDTSGRIFLWDAASGELSRAAPPRAIGAHPKASHLVFTAQAASLVTAASDGTIRQWRIGGQTPPGAAAFLLLIAPARAFGELSPEGSPQPLGMLAETHLESPVLALAISQDGRQLAAVTADRRVHLWSNVDQRWDPDTKLTRRLDIAVSRLGFSPDGRYLVADGAGGFGVVPVSVMESASAPSPEALLRVDPVSHEGARIPDFSRDGSYLVGVTPAGAAIWEASGAKVTYFEPAEATRVARFDPRGDLVATLSGPGLLQMWRVRGDSSLSRVGERLEQVNAVAFTSDGTRAFIAGVVGVDGAGDVWEVESGRKISSLDVGDRVRQAAFNPRGDRLVTAGGDGMARIWDVEAGRELVILRGHEDVIDHVAFSSDGTKVITASHDCTARVWSAESGQELTAVQLHHGPVLFAALSPDGTRIVSASEDGTTRIWSAESGDEIVTLEGHENWVDVAAFSPDGSQIVTASRDQTARVWSAESGLDLAVLEGHQDSVVFAAFSPDGTRIVTTSGDQTARLWDAMSGTESAALEGHQARIDRATFSPDGSKLVTASADGTARVWSAESGQLIAVLEGHEVEVLLATFSADGSRVNSVTAGSWLRTWILEPDELIAQACARLTRNLTLEEWDRYLDGERYSETCEIVETAIPVADDGR